MSSDRLPNYLRTHRKRTCLSQEDVAFLLGAKGGAGICRHERFQQTPNLETLLAYEILFRTPARRLFRGVHRDVEQRLKHRAVLLLRKLMQTSLDKATRHKLEILREFLEQAA